MDAGGGVYRAHLHLRDRSPGRTLPLEPSEVFSPAYYKHMKAPCHFALKI
jgi:hypothetical protein